MSDDLTSLVIAWRDARQAWIDCLNAPDYKLGDDRSIALFTALGKAEQELMARARALSA